MNDMKKNEDLSEGKKKAPAYFSPQKLADYLYAIEYDDYIPQIAGDITPAAGEVKTEKMTGGCSTVRNGHYFGRNLDLTYCACPEFVVRVDRGPGRFASIGLAANPYIGTDVSAMSKEELIRLPAITNDGINENGVAASVHVVLAGDIDDRSGTDGTGERIDGRQVVRYVLDHAESAEHAVSLLQQANITGGFDKYGLHWMIADKSDSFVAEVIHGKLTLSRNIFPILTNFYLNYGPVQKTQTAAGKVFHDMPLLNDYAIGVERWEYLRDHYDESSSASGMAKLMEKVRATAIYTQEEAADWLTEHSGEGLTIKSPREDFLRILCDQKEKYEHRDRLNPKGDWITWHTSVYDIDQKKLTVWSQEDYTRPFIFIL